MKKWLIWLVVAVVALGVLAFGGAYVYTNWINDEPDALSTEDLSEAVSGSDAPADGAESTTAAGSSATTGGGDETSPTDVSGVWTVVSEDSQVGYRVKEVLFGQDTEGVGRTSDVTGTMTIDGRTVTDASFEVDMTTVESDESRRDSQFRGRIMEVDTYPTATFVLTAPIDFGTVPASGEQITATATGDLTLHGVTQSVTFEVTAQLEGDRIGVLGSIPITFADYDIDNPSFGPAKTGDDGTLEFVLVFEPAT